LHLNRLAAYRDACRELVRRFGETENPVTANNVAWACALGPDAVADLKRCVKLAERAVADDPNDYACLNTLGAILYRAGAVEAAIDKLNEAMKTQGEGGTYGDWLFLAMAHHRLDHPEEAARWLEKTVNWVEENKGQNAKAETEPSTLAWDDRLELRILRKEAESLIRQEAE
jgi:tetratricopeptide (TPR) repeat protein